MSALGEINKKNSKEWTPLELTIWLSSLGVGMPNHDERLEAAAAELARLQAIEAAARDVLDTAGGSGELTDLVMKREKRYRLADALAQPERGDSEKG
jgi:hypothetical protein